MPRITDLASLKTEAKAALARGDDLDDRLPLFVQLAEARIASGSGEPGDFQHDALRCIEMLVTDTLTIDAQDVALPEDCLQIKGLTRKNDGRQIQSDTQSNIAKQYGLATGMPRRYCRIGNSARFGPIPDGSYDADIVYFARPSALESDEDSNDVLLRYPNVYLTAVLAEAFNHVRNTQSATEQLAKLAGAIRQVNADTLSRLFASPWVGRLG